MKNEEKALKLAGLKETPDEEERYYNPFNCKIYDKCLEMADWKDEYYKKLLDLLVKSGANVDIITDYIKNCIEL